MTDNLNRDMADRLHDCRAAAGLTTRGMSSRMSDELGYQFSHSVVSMAENNNRRVTFHEAYTWCSICGFDLPEVLTSAIDGTPLAPARISMFGQTYVKESA